jgi:hypothetical protein
LEAESRVEIPLSTRANEVDYLALPIVVLHLLHLIVAIVLRR